MRFSCGIENLRTRTQIVRQRQYLAGCPPANRRGHHLVLKIPQRSVTSCSLQRRCIPWKVDLGVFGFVYRGSYLHRYQFSTTTDVGSNGMQQAILMRQLQLMQHITHSTRSLGVWEAVEYFDSQSRSQQKSQGSVWESIHKLPEVETAISKLYVDLPLSSAGNMLDSIQALERACQIFGSYQTGSMEHMACSALLAEFQNRSHRYRDCSLTLQEMLRVCNKDEIVQEELRDAIQLGLAKLHWLYGHHEEAKVICETLVDQNRQIEAAARTGQALSRLLLVSSLDDVFSVRDPFRMTVKHLERTVHPASTILVAAHLNLGVAEAVWAETVTKHNNVDAPLDAAMRSWKQGLTTLKKGKSGTPSVGYRVGESSSLRVILRARLLANMAWGMLQMTHQVDYLSRAMEFATESLSVYDSIAPVVSSASNESGLGRTLSLLGSCYHLNGNAITAQGLLQSAFDKVPIHFSSSPVTMASALQCLEQRDAYLRYASLCHDWEKRESEAEQMKQLAKDIDSSVLPDGWSEKSSIHGSLWFWTSATAQRH